MTTVNHHTEMYIHNTTIKRVGRAEQWLVVQLFLDGSSKYHNNRTMQLERSYLL